MKFTLVSWSYTWLVRAYVLYLDASLLCFTALLIGFRVNQQAATFIHIKWLVHVDVLCLNTSLLCFTAMLLEFSYCYNKMINCYVYSYRTSLFVIPVCRQHYSTWTNRLSFFSQSLVITHDPRRNTGTFQARLRHWRKIRNTLSSGEFYLTH
jgi:hypothetical protein